MAFTTRVTRHPGYVQVEVAGPTSIKDFVELISTLGQETVYWSDRRVLVDLRQEAEAVAWITADLSVPAAAQTSRSAA